MTSRIVTLPELGLIAGTRVALGIGVGLLLAGRLEPQSRRAAGAALLAVGALSTIPLAVGVLGGRRLTEAQRHEVAESSDIDLMMERTPAGEL